MDRRKRICPVDINTERNQNINSQTGEKVARHLTADTGCVPTNYHVMAWKFLSIDNSLRETALGF
jgi:hypothetical protein